MTAPNPPVDVMVRTSGEKRLSDFLLWQSQNAIFEFKPILWPDMGPWEVVKTILLYRLHTLTQFLQLKKYVRKEFIYLLFISLFYLLMLYRKQKQNKKQLV